MSLLGVSTSVFSADAGEGVSRFLTESPVTVDFDRTLVVQVVLFLFLLAVLKPLLFDPMLRLFEEREKRIEGTKELARKENQKSATAKTKADAIVAKGKEAGALERDTLRAEGMKREAELLAVVRAESAETLERGRAEIGTEAKAARDQLRGDARSLARDMASRVLGREVAS